MIHIRIRNMIVLVSPALGAFVADIPARYPDPVGYWQGFVVQLALLATPVAVWLSGTRWASIGFSTEKWKSSIFLGVLYSLIYMALVAVATRFGVHLSHFDSARRTLGLPLVLLMYIPFWGVLESVWMAYAYTVIDG
ncbi:MAG: hypothetical protein K6T83_22770 [Alicyclobacillus sp.]|nr:hypothetical protein [Alicyclobacillus sp.]